MKSKPIVHLDIETTGTSKTSDRIIELSMIKTIDGNIVKEILHRYDPEMSIPIEASLIHGIYDHDVAGQPTFGSMAPMILEFIKDCVISGYNIMSFDVPMLFNEFHRAGYAWDYGTHQYIDTFILYRKMYPSNLSEVYKKLTGNELESAHSAQADVVASMTVLDHLQKEGAPTDIDKLNSISLYDRKLLDISGKFKYNDKGDVVFAFGKHADKLAKANVDYLKWMLDSDFTEDVKMTCRKLIKGIL